LRRYVAVALATACAANVAAVHAQGAVPQTAPAIATGATVEVRSFEVRGVTRFEHEQIDAVLRPFTGRALTPAQINEAAAALTAYYRKAGYFVAQAFVPPQSVGGGNVVLEMYEGRLEKDGIDVSGSNERVRNDVVRGILEAALTSEPVIRIGEYERGLLLATDLPGISVQSTLAPGSAPGTARLRAQVIDEPAWSGQVEADNSGYEDLGKYRIGGTLTWNSPTGVGDQFSVRLLTAGSGANNASLSYSRPVGSHGTRVGASLDAYVYAYDNITGLGSATGDARDVRLFASHPLVRARHFNLRLNGDYSYSRYNDTNDTGPTSLRDINLLTIGVAADDDLPYLGLLGQGDLTLAVSAGNVDLRGDEFSIAFDNAFTRTNGNFARLNLDASRRVFVAPNWSVLVKLRAQAASRNLDASQKMYFGGSDSVSGYRTGAVGGDQGGEVEFAVARDFANLPWSGALRTAVFYQAAALQQFRSPYIDPSTVSQSIDNNVRLQSVGLRLHQSWGTEWSAKLRVAWRIGSDPFADVLLGPSQDASSERYQIWFNLVRAF
jgi:hemolysin activation/secretion protein